MTDAVRVTSESEIHDLGYRRYEGARIGAWGAWRALFRQGFRAMFGLGRTAKAKVIPAFVFVTTMLPMLGQVSAASMSQGVLKIRVAGFIGPMVVMFTLWVAAQAPEVLSRDQQHRVLPLILTRDVTRTAYATARLASIVAALFLLALAPLLLYYIGEIGIATDPAAQFALTGKKIFPVLAQAALTAIALGGVGAALASWTPRRAYATAAILGTFMVATAIGANLDEIAGVSPRFGELLSPPFALETQGMLFFGERNRRMDRSPPLPIAGYAMFHLAVGAVGAALLGLRIWRVRP
jgi:ABC-2 type transport system permease protein